MDAAPRANTHDFHLLEISSSRVQTSSIPDRTISIGFEILSKINRGCGNLRDPEISGSTAKNTGVSPGEINPNEIQVAAAAEM